MSAKIPDSKELPKAPAGGKPEVKDLTSVETATTANTQGEKARIITKLYRNTSSTIHTIEPMGSAFPPTAEAFLYPLDVERLTRTEQVLDLSQQREVDEGEDPNA